MKRILLIFALALPLVGQANSFKTQQWQTKKGARVIFYQAKEVPMLTINLAFAAGSAYDGQWFGLSALTASLINQGNGGLDANQVAEKLANTGAQFAADSSRDMIVLSLKTLTDPSIFKPAIATFSLIVNQPDFPKNAFEREKKQQLMAIAQANDFPDEVANQLFFETLYKDHPYAHPINGTKDSISLLPLEEVRNFYKKYFVAENAVIVLVGAIDQEKARHIAEELVESLPKGAAAPTLPKAISLTAGEKIKMDFPSSQTMLRLGQIGINHYVADYFPLAVGNYILGGGALVSRLAYEVREKHGLTYDILSQLMPMPGEGPFMISLATQNKQAAQALEITEQTLKEFIDKGPNESELTAAKRYLMGSFPLTLASNSSIASMLLRLAFYRLPDNYLDTYVDRINAVTTAEIKQAFQKRIHPQKMVLVSVGK